MNAIHRRRDAIDIFNAGVRAAGLPWLLGGVIGGSDGWLRLGPHLVATEELRRVVVIGAGKAARHLAASALPVLCHSLPPSAVVTGMLLVPERPHDEGPAGPDPQALDVERLLEVLEVRPRDANEPTERAVAATKRALELARSLNDRDVLLCLFTGGGSATLTAPWPGLSLEDKLEAIRLLSRDGASIAEINTLRRHLSAVKGGRLAEAASGAQAVCSLLISDVDGDLPHVIASGPAVPDPTTFAEALALRDEWPDAVRRHLETGTRGEIPDTPARLPRHIRHQIVRSPDHALEGAVARAIDRDWRAQSLPRPTPSDLGAATRLHVDAMRRAPAGTAILSIGEAPLTLPPSPPRGGRAGHLALAIAVAADADPRLRGRVTVLVGATDGEDGSSGWAGGVVDSDLLRRAEAAGLDPLMSLDRRESLGLLERCGGLLPGWDTGTNVQDLRVILVA